MTSNENSPLRVAADLLQEGHPPGNHVLAKYLHDAADEIERLRVALDWYANPRVYVIDGDPGETFSDAECDRGERARKCLAGETPGDVS